jgi:hypothetical protein
LNEREERQREREDRQREREDRQREREDIQREREYFQKIESLLTQQVLAAKGMMTSRGIFEHVLKLVHMELELKGNFNASNTCDYIANNFQGTQSLSN